jgi:hypothetical protein
MRYAFDLFPVIDPIRIKESLKFVVDFVENSVGEYLNRLPRQSFAPEIRVLVQEERFK